MEFIKPDVNIDFVGHRKIAFIVSVVVILIGLAGLIWRGASLYGKILDMHLPILTPAGQPVPTEG